MAVIVLMAINLRGKSEIGSTFVTVLQRYSQALQDAVTRAAGPVVRADSSPILSAPVAVPPAQAVWQQTPSVQWPAAHWLAASQAAPAGCLGTQTPAEQ